MTKRIGETKPVGVTKCVGETKPVGVTKRVGETKPAGVTERVGETKPAATHLLFTEVYDLNNTFVLQSRDFCSYYSLLFFSLSLFIIIFKNFFNVYYLSNLCFGDLLTFPSLSQCFSTSRPPKDFSSKTNITQRHQSASEDFSSKINVTQRH